MIPLKKYPVPPGGSLEKEVSRAVSPVSLKAEAMAAGKPTTGLVSRLHKSLKTGTSVPPGSQNWFQWPERFHC